MKDFTDFRIAIIGLGYVGLPLAVEFGKKFKTIGFDIKTDRIEEIKDGHDSTLEVLVEDLKKAKLLTLTDNLEEISDCNFFIVTVPTPIDKENKPDLKPLLRASENIGQLLKKGDIVVYESTVYPGATEEECVPILEKESQLVYNKDFFGSTTTYNNFNTNLDVLFNGHIHCGHEPEYINDTWYINSGSVTRMHKPKPLFYPRYTTCEIENKKEEWKFENVIFDCSEKDIFNEIEKRSFNDFISSIETKRIDSNALDYMFQKAKVSLTQNAFNALNELYGEVR